VGIVSQLVPAESGAELEGPGGSVRLPAELEGLLVHGDLLSVDLRKALLLSHDHLQLLKVGLVLDGLSKSAGLDSSSILDKSSKGVSESLHAVGVSRRVLEDSHDLIDVLRALIELVVEPVSEVAEDLVAATLDSGVVDRVIVLSEVSDGLDHTGGGPGDVNKVGVLVPKPG
jgi:hypothetical protein